MAERDHQRTVGALVGAAFGDALGWPHEQRASAVQAKRGHLGLYDWIKRSGGRFQPHTEEINAGSYSDDTQLILAVARARLSGDKWWEKLASVELPFWTLYERGGGGATIRAARSLLKGVLPWEGSAADQTKYFAAGGNGVAMRVLAHVIVGTNFSEIAKSVLADGVVTHGHPRALVGALAYAYGLDVAFSSRGTLEYGALLRQTLEGVDAWSQTPDIAQYWPTWANAVEGVEDYQHQWDGAVFELYEALRLALKGLDAGALSNDDEILEKLGCFNRKINGAGTVAAAASLFLASKHASAPIEGVARAALADGADTDTLASMCGGLAGAFAGVGWLGTRVGGVQDLLYLDYIGSELSTYQRSGRPTDRYRSAFTGKAAERLISELRHGRAVIELPFGEIAQVETHTGVRASGSSIAAQSWRLQTAEHQTFYVKKLSKTPSPSATRKASKSQPSLIPDRPTKGGTVSRITILVRDVAKARDFYADTIGLEVTEDAPRHVKLGPVIWLRQADAGEVVGGVSIYIDVPDLAACHERVSRSQAIRVSKVALKGGRDAFACHDVDGHRLEIFQA